MTERKLPRPAGDVVEDGVPAIEEVRDEVLQTGDAAVGDMPMPDRPLGADQWGITAFEERSGEPLDRRVAHEQLGDRDFVIDDGLVDDTLAAEEAAMHIVDENELR